MGFSSTGWETFLDAVIRAGFAVTGTWPMRTELSNRMVGMGTNALASSIVLVCRKRPQDAPLATRREFVTALRDELPAALAYLQSGNIAPVDLAQAAIGPGMAVYTRYARVLDAEGKRVSVREALALINQTLDEVLAEQEGEFDADTRWALAWFEQQGFGEGEYGIAETLSKAKNTSIAGIVEGGILASSGGKVRLLGPDELAGDWDPTTDDRLTVWEAVHHLIRALDSGGETGAASSYVNSAALRRRPVNWPTVSTRSVSASGAPRKPAPTTAWSRVGRRSRACRGRRRRPSRAGCSAMEIRDASCRIILLGARASCPRRERVCNTPGSAGVSPACPHVGGVGAPAPRPRARRGSPHRRCRRFNAREIARLSLSRRKGVRSTGFGGVFRYFKALTLKRRY